MDKQLLLNQILSILPTSIDIINHSEIINGQLILTNEENKFTFICYTKSLNESSSCKTFYHKDVKTGETFYKDKIKYLTDKEAIHAAMSVNIQSKTIHKRVAYKCKECGFWHIGRNQSVLTDDEKKKIKIKHSL